ncbi:phosphate:Na+ symporter [Roseovarius tolerans]|uniref:Phosphate:Na+ symporter n=1 Tax=Roseovarius tolerans TaxID=74031 RepID=A0A1H7WVA7_9RHOB|nr:Na/Pi cotransporter family protein [Roseovarius tolerans]SEM25472.1 phosphate:Na+ symporter [Roseovarius tolerans]
MESTPVLFVVNMAAAAALLIWAVRLVRTGFERALGAKLRLWLRRSTSNRLAAAGSGAATAVLMQSSTAVAVLMAGFVTTGAIGSVAGLAIMLGADLGSAIVALVLSSQLAVVTPVLLLAGVMIFLRSSARRMRQVGRILIGLSLVFLSLDLIREASLPLTGMSGAEVAMLYLAEDALLAFVIAALFAWLVHSSVAAVLLFATLAAEGVMPVDVAFAMVLGANLGGSIVAVVLTLNAESAVRRVVWCNLVLRGGGAGALLVWLANHDLPFAGLDMNAGHQALFVHLAFNVVLLLVSLPLVGPFMKMARMIVPDEPQLQAEGASRSALDPTVQNQPKRAFGCAQRELVEMAHRIEIMLRTGIGLFERYDDATAKAQRAEVKALSQMSLDIRTYLSRVRSHDPDEDTSNRAFELSGIAVNLEAGADVIARKMVDLARAKDVENLEFSPEGWRELSDFHDVVLRNVQHGISVLMSEDIGLARELVEQKEQVRDLEQNLQRRHLKRLRKGLAETFETSAIHLDLLRALKMLNTSFAMIAYPVLEDRGELLESRLASS